MNKKPFLVIFLTVFMDLVGFGIIIPLNPFLARQFGADPFQVGLLMTVYSLLQLLFAPIWGQLSDRWGRRPIILVSVFGAGISHLMFGFANTLLGLYLARGLAGLFGGNISAAMAAMADLTPPKERSKGMGIIGAAFGLGFILGPFLGGIFADVGSRLGAEPPYGASFPAIIAAGICFMNFVLAYFILPETRPRDARTVQGKRPPRWTMLVTTWRQPVLGSVLTIFFLVSLAMAHMEASLFLLVQDRFGWGMTKASLGFCYVGLMIAFTQGFLIRKTLPRWGEAKSFMIGLAALAVGFIGIAWAQNIWVLTIAVTSLAMGNGFATPALLGSVSLLSPPESQGGHLGVNQSLSSLGRIIGPALGGLFYREYGMSVPFVVAGTLILMGIAIGYRIRRKLPKGATAH